MASLAVAKRKVTTQETQQNLKLLLPATQEGNVLTGLCCHSVRGGEYISLFQGPFREVGIW